MNSHSISLSRSPASQSRHACLYFLYYFIRVMCISYTNAFVYMGFEVMGISTWLIYLKKHICMHVLSFFHFGRGSPSSFSLFFSKLIGFICVWSYLCITHHLSVIHTNILSGSKLLLFVTFNFPKNALIICIFIMMWCLSRCASVIVKYVVLNTTVHIHTGEVPHECFLLQVVDA